MPEEARDPSIIRGYHAHIYFEPGNPEPAAKVRELIARTFPHARLGGWRPMPVGPHTKAMYLIEIMPGDFAQIIPWLMLNRRGLSVLVHPFTGNGAEDHAVNSFWMGESLALKTENL
jgi:aromatic ring-cleaving dioxygenase